MRILKAIGEFILLALFFFALVVVGFVVVTNVAHAAGTTAQVTWTLPASYNDNSPLPAADIAETVIEWRRHPTGPVVGSLRVAAPAISVDVPGLSCGDFVFAAWVVTRPGAAHPSVAGEATAPIPYATGVVCRPKAPGLSVS